MSVSAGTEGGGTVHHQTVGPLLSRPSVGTQARAQTALRCSVPAGNSTDGQFEDFASNRKDDCL